MKVDMHIHTVYSQDSEIELLELLRYARNMGIGVGITDHNRLKGALHGVKLGRSLGVFVVPGIEVSTKAGHVIGYNLDVEIKPGLSVEETVERIRDAGGFVVIPHPFRMVSGIGGAVCRVYCDAIEVQNSRNSARANRRAGEVAEMRKKGRSAGSDAHSLYEVGTSYVVADAENAENLLEQIARGWAKVQGSSRGLGSVVVQYGKMLRGYIKRGCKRV
ncbi:MAG: PHP domain-containing protein [Thermoplasmata archaeon]|nr:PHP domain-containing protein [Thermoplasmata archaeon]